MQTNNRMDIVVQQIKIIKVNIMGKNLSGISLQYAKPVSLSSEVLLGNKYNHDSLSEHNKLANLIIRNWEGDGTDGIQLNGNDFYMVKNCVIHRNGSDPTSADESASGINGADVIFYRCRFRDNGKGYLQGTGETNDFDLLLGQRAIFYECIFENNSRRNPFIQVGQGYLIRCLVKNWGKCFHEKSFGARAGSCGQLLVVDSIFEQENFLTCLKRFHTLKDTFGQYLWPLFGVPGFMRGAYADIGGHVITRNCYKNRWWIYLQNRQGKMSYNKMFSLKTHLETNVPDDIETLDEE